MRLPTSTVRLITSFHSSPAARDALMPATINQLMINSPYKEPSQYWSCDRERRTFNLSEGKRRS